MNPKVIFKSGSFTHYPELTRFVWNSFHYPKQIHPIQEKRLHETHRIITTIALKTLHYFLTLFSYRYNKTLARCTKDFQLRQLLNLFETYRIPF